MSNSKNKRYEQKQLYTDGTVQRDNRPIRTETDGGGTNHLRIFADNRKLFDYYPLRMKLFDYRQWKQLTYPSLIEGADKWETELDEIIKRLMVSPQ